MGDQKEKPEMSDEARFDLPAVYHEHGGPTEHSHEHTGPGHYSGETGHFHLTEVYTAEELAEVLGVSP